ncbi:hypothetical protein BGZ83_012095 [Gryganskiella cystojenkinii]|nr:hypothetical protein BGZ83_012095 [Gryganskiella cystojenkinii]
MASSFSQLRGQQQSEKQQRSSTSVHDYPASSASRARPRTRPQRQPQIVLEIGYDSDKEMGVRVETLQTGGVIYTNDKASTGGESAAFETEQGKELREKPKKGSSSDESNLNRFLEQIFPLEAGDEGSRNQYKEDEDEEEKENITGYRNQLAGAIRFLQAHNYQLDGSKLLGHGGAGFVISARKENGHEVAVKVMPGGSSTAELEVDVVMSLDHENIIKAANHYYEISDRGHCDLHILISNRASMNLSEFIQSRQLFKNPKDKTRFPSGIRQDVVKSIFKQIFRGLQYLHSHFGEDGKTRVVSHGDIKADNILLFFRKEEEEEDNATEGVGCRVQICDFGCSMEVNDAFEPPYFVYGTRGWGPPEMDKNVISREMLKKGDLGTLPQSKWPRFTGLQADIFALGLILHMLIYGDLPLELKLLDEDRAPEELSEQEREMLKLYTAHRRTGKGYAFRHIEDRRVDRVLWSLLKMMLEANPKHRISLANIENQPWVKNT